MTRSASSVACASSVIVPVCQACANAVTPAALRIGSGSHSQNNAAARSSGMAGEAEKWGGQDGFMRAALK